MNKLFDLTGRTALITGSSRGIGRSIALTLAEANANVIIQGTSNSSQLQETVKNAKRFNVNVYSVIADLSTKDGVDGLIKDCKATNQNIDILVLNASVQDYVTLEDFSRQEFTREFDTNVASSIELIKAFSPAMKQKQWGRIVMIGSVNQMRPSGRLTIYSATKAALANLTQNFAKTLAPDNITVNNIAPGVITTDRNKKVLSDSEFSDNIMKIIPAQRFGTPDDCVGAVLLLTSDAGSYITGAELPISGGMHL